MPVYAWEGRDPQGRKIRGELEARDVQTVFNTLKSQRIVPAAHRIREKGRGLNAEIKIPGLGPRVRQRDLVVFTRQFSTLIDAGLPLVQGLEILARQSANPAVRKVILGIKERVETGGTLADGLRTAPKLFDDLFVNMVIAGESGGILDTILERLSTHLEKSMRLRREVKTAMIYPLLVILVAVAVTSVILIFVIPTFAELFAGFGATLPAPTMVVIALSNFMIDWWWGVFGGLALGLLALVKFARTDRGKGVIHPLLLRMPIFGEIIRKVAIARFSRTLGTMTASGVPILEGLRICAHTAGNRVVEREVQHARHNISEGRSMSEPLEGSKVFPPMVVQMIAVGEKTGALDRMLAKIADFYEDEVDNAIKAMKQILEPLLIVIIGMVVGALVIAMYLPIFKMGAVMSTGGDL